MQILRVDEIIGPIGTGICEPLFAKIGDTNIVLKTYNNIESNKVLANELICFKIAKILDLPIPEAGVCVVDKKVIQNEQSEFILDDECYGVGFYSTRIDRVTRAVLTPKIVEKFISNKEDVFRIILFDHLICNKDRHKNNFLLKLGDDKKLYIIDHSHVFNFGSIWDEYQLQRLIEEEDYRNNDVLMFNRHGYEVFFESININENELLSYSIEFEKKLNREIFNSIVYELPDEWGISNGDKDKLVEYLGYRLDNLKNMCNKIINHFY